jgi:hypothetical protein
MADLDFSASVNISDVTGLDKVHNEIEKTLTKTVERLKNTASKETYLSVFSEGLNKGFGALSATKLSAATAQQYTKDLVLLRQFVNMYASDAGRVGDVEKMAEAAGMREFINKMVGASRGFASYTERQENKKAKQEEQSRKEAERTKNEEARKLVQMQAEKEIAATKRSGRWQYTHAYNTLAERLAGGDIDYEEASDLYDDLMRRRTRMLGTYSGRDRWKHDDDSRKQTKLLKEQVDALQRNTKAIVGWKTYLAAGATGMYVGNTLSNIATAYYSNRNDPFSSLRRTVADYGQKAGAGIGAVIGGILGNLVLPGVGGVIGATVGGGAGAWMGGERKRSIAAAETTQAEAVDQRRWRALYGNRTLGYQYAKLAEKTGFVGSSDVQTITSNANTFMAAAAFGGVSDQQYMALSMLPNYYAAMVSGADEQTLMEALQADYASLGPGMAQYFSQMAGIPENIRAFVGSGMLGEVGKDVRSGFVGTLEGALERATGGALSALYSKGRKDRLGVSKSLLKTVSRPLYMDYLDRFNDTTFEQLPPFLKDKVLNAVPPYEHPYDYAPRGVYRKDDDDTLEKLQNLSRATVNVYIDNDKAFEIRDVYAEKDMLNNIITTNAGN